MGIVMLSIACEVATVFSLWVGCSWPCTMHTLAALWLLDFLESDIEEALADVHLRGGRRLILEGNSETNINSLQHLKNMTAVTEWGRDISPCSLLSKPDSIAI